MEGSRVSFSYSLISHQPLKKPLGRQSIPVSLLPVPVPLEGTLSPQGTLLSTALLMKSEGQAQESKNKTLQKSML